MQALETGQDRAAGTCVNLFDKEMRVKTIVTLAIVLRLGIAALMLSIFSKNWIFHEAEDLGFLAQALNSGHGLSSPFGGLTGPTALVTPGYPIIIAVIFHLFGSYSLASAVAVMVLQTIFAALTIVVLMSMARRLFGVQAAHLSGMIWAVSLPLLWLPTIFWDTSLSTLFVVGTIALALRAMEQPDKGWMVIGIYGGVVMWVNPSLVSIMLVSFSWAAYQGRRRSQRKPLVALFVAVVIFSPWTIRNALVLHAFVPLRSSFGYELWQGNRPKADGIFEDSLYPTHSRFEYADYLSQGEIAFMHRKQSLAMGYIRSNPMDFVKVTLKRAVRFWIGTDGKVNSPLIAVHAIATSSLGLLGLVFLFKRSKPLAMLFLLPLLVFPLPYYVTDIKFRYRLEIDPLLTVLSAYAVFQLTALWSRQSAISSLLERTPTKLGDYSACVVITLVTICSKTKVCYHQRSGNHCFTFLPGHESTEATFGIPERCCLLSILQMARKLEWAKSD